MVEEYEYQKNPLKLYFLDKIKNLAEQHNKEDKKRKLGHSLNKKPAKPMKPLPLQSPLKQNSKDFETHQTNQSKKLMNRLSSRQKNISTSNSTILPEEQ